MSSAMRKPSRDVSTNGPRQLFARRERRAVHDEVEAAECLARSARATSAICSSLVDVERQHQRIGELRRQLAHVFLESLALVGHGEPRARRPPPPSRWPTRSTACWRRR